MASVILQPPQTGIFPVYTGVYGPAYILEDVQLFLKLC